jgi:hypothetical protein
LVGFDEERERLPVASFLHTENESLSRENISSNSIESPTKNNFLFLALGIFKQICYHYLC